MQDPDPEKTYAVLDLGLKKTSDPGYGSATLAQCVTGSILKAFIKERGAEIFSKFRSTSIH
jgi:hypothetical protein